MSKQNLVNGRNVWMVLSLLLVLLLSACSGDGASQGEGVTAPTQSELENGPSEASNPAETEELEESPSIMITEMVPKSDGGDRYGFVEIMNVTDETISLEGYQLHYYYDVDAVFDGRKNIWEIVTDSFNSSYEIGPGELRVIWIKHEVDHDAPLSDFLDNYNLTANDLDPGKVLSIKNPEREGMNGDKPRAAGIVSPDGRMISGAAYNQGDLDVDTNLSVTYDAPSDGSNIMVKKDTFQEPSPGSLEPIPRSVGAEDEPISEATDLSITEILPKSSEGNRHAFVEIRNNRHESLELDGYKIHYYYGEEIFDGKHNTWEIVTDSFNSSSEIGPGESKVIWIKKEQDHDAPLSEFLDFYDLGEDALPANQVLVVKNPGNEGLNGDKPRAVGIISPDGELISGAMYNQEDLDVDTDLSVTFGAPQEGSVVMEIKDTFQEPSPGKD